LGEEKRRHIYPVFRYLLQIAYDAGRAAAIPPTTLRSSSLSSLLPIDLLSEETLLLWADTRASSGDAERRELFLEPVVQEFVTWLRDSAEESEEGDDDDEEDSEEEEED
jgi:hypothetical protein